MGVDFVLLTGCTSCNEFVHIGRQAQPPKVLFQESFGVEPTCMAKGGGVM